MIRAWPPAAPGRQHGGRQPDDVGELEVVLQQGDPMVTTAIKVVIRMASTQNSTSITVSVSRVPLRVNGIIVRSTSVMVSPTVAVSSQGGRRCRWSPRTAHSHRSRRRSPRPCSRRTAGRTGRPWRPGHVLGPHLQSQVRRRAGCLFAGDRPAGHERPGAINPGWVGQGLDRKGPLAGSLPVTAGAAILRTSPIAAEPVPPTPVRNASVSVRCRLLTDERSTSKGDSSRAGSTQMRAGLPDSVTVHSATNRDGRRITCCTTGAGIPCRSSRHTR